MSYEKSYKISNFVNEVDEKLLIAREEERKREIEEEEKRRKEERKRKIEEAMKQRPLEITVDPKGKVVRDIEPDVARLEEIDNVIRNEYGKNPESMDFKKEAVSAKIVFLIVFLLIAGLSFGFDRVSEMLNISNPMYGVIATIIIDSLILYGIYNFFKVNVLGNVAEKKRRSLLMTSIIFGVLSAIFFGLYLYL